MCFLNIKACQHILLHQIHKIMIFKIASYDPFKSNLFNKSLRFYLWIVSLYSLSLHIHTHIYTQKHTHKYIIFSVFESIFYNV